MRKEKLIELKELVDRLVAIINEEVPEKPFHRPSTGLLVTPMSYNFPVHDACFPNFWIGLHNLQGNVDGRLDYIQHEEEYRLQKEYEKSLR
jgi:hypothetical protein